jgi:hypothetical protein
LDPRAVDGCSQFRFEPGKRLQHRRGVGGAVAARIFGKEPPAARRFHDGSLDLIEIRARRR